MLAEEIRWRAAGYEWALSRPLVPLTGDDEAERAFAERRAPGADFREYMHHEVHSRRDGDELPQACWYAFKRGAMDALPLYVEDGGNFSLSQIAAATNYSTGYIRAEVAAGRLKAGRSGKLWYVSPDDFAEWFLRRQWDGDSEGISAG